jgi:DNA-binding GntR family transcriptional regulator
MRKSASDPTSSSRSRREEAYRHILAKIASGELKAGSTLSEVSLARNLGSSRTPVREALSQLVAEGLLEQTPNRGAVVVELKRQDIVELYELREALEVYAIGKAARIHVRLEELEPMRRIVKQVLLLKQELERSGRSALDFDEMRHLVACDLGYHSLLVRLGGNARILKVLNETRLLIRIFSIHRSGHDAAQIENICRQHMEILDAVADRDAERAMHILSAHILASRQERLDEYDHWQRESSLRSAFPAFLDVPGALNRSVS